MADAIAAAKTGLDAAQKNLDYIAHDAANAKSLAYKARILVTTDNFYTTLKRGGLRGADSGFASPAPIQKGSGSKIAGVTKNLTQGERKDTNNPLDLYIDGNGYFAVALPNNRVGYTRGGSFKKRADGRIVTSAHGYELINNEVTIPDNISLENVEISQNGQVINTRTNDVIDTIQLTSFSNELGLEEIGGGILVETEASGAPNLINPGDDIDSPRLIQRALEMSNVSQIDSLTDLIGAQRYYELNLKIVAAQNEMLKNTNDTFK